MKNYWVLALLLLSTSALASPTRQLEAQSIKNGSGVLTLPTSTDTLVGKNTSDNLTNKTIDGGANSIVNIAPTSVTGLSGANSGDVSLGTPNGLSLLGQVLSLQVATSFQTGALTAADYMLFNAKQPAGNYPQVQTGAVDPSSTATSGEPGDLYVQNATDVFIKLDSGMTTAWMNVGSGGGGPSFITDGTNSSTLQGHVANNSATGLYSIALGDATLAAGDQSIAAGTSSSVGSGSANSVAIGVKATVNPGDFGSWVITDAQDYITASEATDMLKMRFLNGMKLVQGGGVDNDDGPLIAQLTASGSTLGSDLTLGDGTTDKTFQIAANTVVDAAKAPTLNIVGSNKTGGTGDGGDVDVTPGTSAGGVPGVIHANGILKIGHLPIESQISFVNMYLEDDNTGGTSISPGMQIGSSFKSSGTGDGGNLVTFPGDSVGGAGGTTYHYGGSSGAGPGSPIYIIGGTGSFLGTGADMAGGPVRLQAGPSSGSSGSQIDFLMAPYGLDPGTDGRSSENVLSFTYEFAGLDPTVIARPPSNSSGDDVKGISTFFRGGGKFTGTNNAGDAVVQGGESSFSSTYKSGDAILKGGDNFSNTGLRGDAYVNARDVYLQADNFIHVGPTGFKFDDNTVQTTAPNNLTGTSEQVLHFNGSGDPVGSPRLTFNDTDGTFTIQDATSDHVLQVQRGRLYFTQLLSPIATPDANAGTGATCSASFSDARFTLELVTGSAGWATGSQCLISFRGGLFGDPHCIFSPKNAAAATAPTTVMPYITNDSLTLNMNFVNADTSAKTYQWDVFCDN